jgi:carbamoyltransferase
MTVLGISAFYHDSAAAIIKDGDIIAAAQEERFTRKKHDAGFPANAIKYCLEECGTELNKLDAIVFYDKPLLKFERLLETYYGFAPKGLRSFITSMPVWMKEKLFLKKLIKDELKEIGTINKQTPILFPEHHLSHAASAFYPSPYKDAAILTIDGVGEWATASICHGTGSDIKILKELQFPHSLGLLYSAFTYFLGFKVNSGEYKLMGLAPYGNPEGGQVKEYVEKIKNNLVTIYDDGSIWLDQKWFNYAVGLEMAYDSKWEKLFGFKKRKPEDALEQHHCNLGLAIQQITEEVVIKMAKHAKELTNADYLCLAGGVALNCVSNGKLLETGLFKDIFIQPAAGDAGGALGAAYCGYYIYNKNNRVINERDSMKGSYLGPEISEQSIKAVIKKYKAIAVKCDDGEIAQKTASLLANGKITGWVQGRMEFGPRALGGRSILGDPRNPEMQKKLNLKIKFRESFRPFAPSVLDSDCAHWFKHDGISPYMLLVKPIKEEHRKSIPDNYNELDLRNKLYYERSSLPAITHIDFSARIQTVHEHTNPGYYKLISEFKKLTNCGVVINTSFNVRGEPIVCTAEDAYRCFMRTAMDALVIENYLFLREEQPQWKETDNWKEEFVLD